MEHQIHYTGAMDVRCQFSGALRFQREQLNCCHNGKFSLLPLQEYPENLRLLFDADGAVGSNFKQNIRNYTVILHLLSHLPVRTLALLQDVDRIVSVYKVKLITTQATSMQMTLKREDTASFTS
ncbi:hypothetical protein FHG87_005777 [Trinorchestia longiramus]|nr:hypothetical protein FHG87_005777 [Trinorchestia longiramus]